MYNTGFSSGQAVLSESGENKSSTIYKQEQSNSSKETCRWVLMCDDNRGWTFSLEEALLCKRNSCFGQKKKCFKGIDHPKMKMTP